MIIIYLDFVRAGADANSAGGLFFSLIPTVILSGITWVAKRSLFKEFEDDKPAVGEVDEEEETSFLKIGGFSIGAKHRKSFRRATQGRKKSENTGDLVIDIDLSDQRDTDVPESNTQESEAQDPETEESEAQDLEAQESEAAQDPEAQKPEAQDRESQEPEV